MVAAGVGRLSRSSKWSFAWQRSNQIARHRHTQALSLTQPGDGRAYRTWLRNPGDDLPIDQEDMLHEASSKIFRALLKSLVRSNRSRARS